MNSKKANEIITMLEKVYLLEEVKGFASNVDVFGISSNSQDVELGYMFICKGNNFKREYLQSAIDRGAVIYVSENDYNVDIPCILVSNVRKALSSISRWFYDYPGDRMDLVGITGTKGKTTTAYILKSILSQDEKVKSALFSTEGVDTGKSVHLPHLTTPESIDLQAYLSEAKDYGCKRAVMEVSSQAMKYGRLFEQDFEIGIFLNIDRDHIGGNEHENLEEYLDCKISFLKQCKTVIINKQTKHLDKILSSLSKDKRVILYGYDYEADAVVQGMNMNSDGTAFAIEYQNKTYELRTNLIGAFNVRNVTAAVIAAMELGISMDIIQKGIEDIQVPGRMMIYRYKGIQVVVDYAHNNLSVLNLYKTVKDSFNPNKIISVFGCAGGRSKIRRKDIGILANEYSDVVYLTADDPRYEKVSDICDEIKQYIDLRTCYQIEDREEAIITALSSAEDGDAVLIYGKGQDNTQQVNGGFVPYKTDPAIVEDWIKGI